MKTKKVLILLCAFLCSLFCSGQKEWSNWYFSGNNLLTFRNNNIPKIENNFVTPIPFYWWNYYYDSNRGMAYSDPVTGQMRFVLGGRFAYDKNYDIIERSLALRVCPGDKYSYHIIPFQNNPDKFYIIQFQDLYADILAAQTGLQVRCPNAIGLGYSVLDLSLNYGLGDFTSMNNVLRSSIPEGITLVRHANGKDTWVVVHDWGNNKFYAYLFNDNGVSLPVVTAIGSDVSPNSPASAGDGDIIASHDGRTIAMQNGIENFLQLFDFDNSRGTLTNYRTLTIPYAVKRMIFSPDDSKLYFLGEYQTPGVFQFDFNAPDVQKSLTKIADDPQTSFYDMQLGPDGKVYIAGISYYNYPIDDSYLPVIACPNLPKYACNYNVKGLSTPYSYAQFPNFVNDYIRQPKASPVTEFSLGNDTAICFGTFKLTAPAGWKSYRWNTGEKTREITISTPGIYYVLAGEDNFSCPSAFGSIKIVNAAQPLSLGKDTVLCPKSSYTIKAPANFTNLLWNDGTSMQEKVVTNGGKYSLTASDAYGCTNWDTIYVQINFDPRANFGKDTTLCTNQSLLLAMEPRTYWFTKGVTYSWQNGSAKDTFRVTQPGTYWGQVTYQGCTVSDTIRVSYLNPQSLNLGADTSLCAGDSLQLGTGIPNGSYVWSTGETTPKITVRSNGSYWVRVNSGTCTVTDTVNVTFQAKPVVFLGNDTTLCDRQTLPLRVTWPGASCLWQDGSSSDAFLVQAAGWYRAKVTVNGCSTSDSMLVTYKPAPGLTLGKDTALCAGQSFTIDASHPSIRSYLWQDGTAQPARVVSRTGTYSLVATGANGCQSRDTVNVAFNPLPDFTLGTDTVLCGRQKLDLNMALPNASYNWSTGSRTHGITVSQAGIYWLEAVQNGCGKRDSLVVGYKPLPVVNLGNDTTLCEGEDKLLDATYGQAAYQWQDRSTRPDFRVTGPGLFYVAVTLDGCVATDSIQVHYRYKPRFTLGKDTLICMGAQMVLDPNITDARASYLWQNGSVAPSVTVKDAGIYKLTITNECGSSSDEIVIANGVCDLFMPTVFTPNNDGLNDVFRVKYPGFIQVFRMVVYDRKGTVVYNTDNPNAGWDGRYKGKDQPAGNYFWQISLTTKEGKKQSGAGIIMLLR